MMTLSEAIALALESYQAGNLSRAESVCNQVLQQQPNNTQALQLLGIMAHQVGNLTAAIAYYQQLIALVPNQAETHYYLGAALDQQGQPKEAIVYYQQALALKPDYTEVHFDLGTTFKEQGNLSAAIEHYQQALALNPNDAQTWSNLANALLEQGEIEAAIAHYQQALVLQPNVPGIYYNLGNAFRQQNQLEEAITHFRWVLALDPNYTDAYFQLAGVLHSSGQLEEAIFYYQQAIFLKPNSSNIYYYLGNALLEQSKYSDAIIQYRKALELEPQFLDAYIGLGCALILQVQFEEAAACLRQALILNPDHPEGNHNLGLALASQNKVEEAVGYFQKASQLRPDFIEPYWQSQLVLPFLYDDQQQILLWRQRFCRGLNNLIQKTSLDISHTRKPVFTPLEKTAFTFYLNYQGLNDRGVQRKYGKFVHQVMSANFPQWSSPLSMPPLSHTGKIRIGYISNNFRAQTVGLLTLGWLKNCDRQNFEIYSYYIGRQVDFITEQFRACSDGFYHIRNNLEAVCQQIIADKLHVLVFTDIGMDPLITPIAGLKLAPVQCVTWGHPVTSGLPTIDYFLSSELMEPENGQAHYCEQLVRLPNISICYEKPSIPAFTKTRSDFHLRKEAIIYLSCQSLFKYLPQFDYLFAQIAQRVPQAQFAFICHFTDAVTPQFQARLRRAFAELGLNSEDYCVFVPRLNRADYLNLNVVSDIFLDTLSWSGGNTTLEAIACGLPVVTCPGEFMRSRHAFGILKMMGVTQTIAADEAEYVEIAVRLGLNAEWRQEIVRKISDRQSQLFDDKSCVTALESFYKKVVQNQLDQNARATVHTKSAFIAPF